MLPFSDSPRGSAWWLLILSLGGFGLAGCNTMNGGMNNQVGQSYYKQGNYAAARDQFTRASADDPFNPDYYHNLACAMRKQGDRTNAEAMYRQAISVDPGHQPSYHQLATLLREQERHKEAYDLVKAWSDQQPYSDEAHVELAWISREMGDLSGAETSLVQALKINPRNDIASAQLGHVYQDMQQHDKAIAMYQRSLQANWYQPEVQSRLTTLQRENPGAGRDPMLAMMGVSTSTPPTSRYAAAPGMQLSQQYPMPMHSSAPAWAVYGPRAMAIQPAPQWNAARAATDPAHAESKTAAGPAPAPESATSEAPVGKPK